MNSYPRWLWWVAFINILSTLLLLTVGAQVTSTGAGLAVPDWPTSYGYHMFLFPYERWVGGVATEHVHRMIACVVGIFTLFLAVGLSYRSWHRIEQKHLLIGLAGFFVFLMLFFFDFKLAVYLTLSTLTLALIFLFIRFWWKEKTIPMLWMGWFALWLVILQGVLGGLRVVWLKNSMGLIHGCLAQAFLVLLVLITLRLSYSWKNWKALSVFNISSGLRKMILAVTILIFLQLVLGASMRHAHSGLSIPDFPLAYGHIWPQVTSADMPVLNAARIEKGIPPTNIGQIHLQMIHRLFAIFISCGIIVSFWIMLKRKSAPLLSRLGGTWVGLVLVQFSLGAMVIWSGKAPLISTLHVLVGALSLIVGAWMVQLCSEAKRPRVSENRQEGVN